ncbi:peptidase inhibitor family I36 protein [Streptomyces sp. NPDC088354]|uniref:peptidase inhibitor family I36 protein n=1 Tax=Streptomyces sp. NPDC088354 TaxID=3365856 RepID=UPI00382D8B91
MSTTFRMMRRAAVVAACATAAFAAATTQASAAFFQFSLAPGGYSSCDGYTLCVYEHTDFNGWYGFGQGDGQYQLGTSGDRLNNKISSIVNNSSQTYCFFDGNNFDGAKFQVGFGKIYPNLNTAGFGDRIGSWRPGKC